MGNVGRRRTVVVAVFALARLAATLGSDILTNPDTPSYFVFRWWGGVRFPVVAGLYSLVDNHRAIATIQSIVGVVCWSVAAVLLSSLLERPWVATGFEVAVLGLGLTTTVTRFDTALLSESLSISISVLLAALLVRVSLRAERNLAVLTLVVAGLWAFSRQNNAVVMVVLAVAVGLVALWVRPRRLLPMVAVGLAVLALAGVFLATSNTTVQKYNVAQVLQRRIVDDPGYEAWFSERGMPDPSRILDESIDRDASARTRALVNDPSFARWLRSEGTSTYRDFLVSHPGYILSTSLHDRYPVAGFLRGASEFGNSRAVLPEFAEGLYWPKTRADALVAAIVLLPIVSIAILSLIRQRRYPAGSPMAVAVLAAAVMNIVIVTHTAGDSYPRLLMASSTTARVALLWLIAAAFDTRGAHHEDNHTQAEPPDRTVGPAP